MDRLNRQLITSKLFLFVIGILIFSKGVFAWWDCEWKYRVPIQIQENSGTTLTDFQVKVIVDTQSLISAGKMNNDCSDIRFTYFDGSTETEIPYWIESGCNTANTNIWIKVPSIPANGQATVYMYYGNPSPASDTLANNPDQVFEFFDDFEDGSVDTSKWTIQGTVSEETDPTYGVGVLRGEGGNNQIFVCTTNSYNVPVVVEYRMRPETTGDFDSGISFGGVYFISDTGSYGASPCISTNFCYPSGSQGSDLNFHIYRAIVLDGSQQLIDLTSGGSTSASYSVTSGSLCLVGDSDSSSSDTFYDWVLIRKYASSDPSVTIGSEEYAGAIKGISLIEPTNATYVNTDTPLVNVSLVRDCYNYPVTCTLQTTYPASSSFSMESDGEYCWANINLNGLVQEDGELDYKIQATSESSSYSSSEYILYVNTSFSINIVNPSSNNTIVHGIIDIQSSSDSILDIVSCIIETNLGNFTGNLISDSACELNLDVRDLCPDLVWYKVWMENSAGVKKSTDWYVADNDFIYNLQVISPTNSSTIDSDIAIIKITYDKACNQALSNEIIFIYPSSLTDNITCSGTSTVTCTYTKDLNYFVQPDGKVQYKIKISHTNEVEESDIYEFYVPTSHKVTIQIPEIGDPVLGSGFHVIAKSDSILKIDSCYPQLPTGAIAKNIVVDPNTKTCEFDVDLSNYCSSNTIDIAVTMENSAQVNATSPTQSHLIYDPEIHVQFTSTTPVNSTDLRYLPIEVQVNKVLLNGKYVPSTKTFAFEIAGTNYTVYGDDSGIARLDLYHPNITNILGTEDGGSITFKVYGLGRCSNINATEQRTVQVPPKIFRVDYVIPPTPNDGDTLSIKFMEIQGNITDNILGNDQCILEISKDDGYTWIPIKNMTNCYAYLVNDELDTPLGYLLYRIRLIDSRWGETNTSVIYRINVPADATPIPTVNAEMDTKTIQQTISSAISNNLPAVLFETGVYSTNLVIDPQGKEIRLIGANSVLEPEAVGFPVITIKSGNVTLEKFTIKDALFNIKVLNGKTTIKDTSIIGGLYGIEAYGGEVYLDNVVTNTKLAGIYWKSVSAGAIKDSKLVGKIWGAKIENSQNIVIDPTDISGKVFGVHLLGSVKNITIDRAKISAKVFGVLIDGTPYNITIKNSLINAQVFGIKTPGNTTIESVVLDGIKVFGIYSQKPNVINNVIIRKGGIFGVYITGNASNLVILNSKLGANLNGEGVINNLTLGDTAVNISYKGSIMIGEKDPTKHPEGVKYTGQAVNVLGNGELNITFLYDNPAYSQYFIYNILGSLITLKGSGKSVQKDKIGIYALYAQ